MIQNQCLIWYKINVWYDTKSMSDMIQNTYHQDLRLCPKMRDRLYWICNTVQRKIMKNLCCVSGQVKYWFLSGRIITRYEVRERAKEFSFKIRIYCSVSSNSLTEIYLLKCGCCHITYRLISSSFQLFIPLYILAEFSPPLHAYCAAARSTAILWPLIDLQD